MIDVIAIRPDNMPRTAILIKSNVDFDTDSESHFWVIETRVIDLTDHEQVAIQFFREMVLQGNNPDPDCHQLIVIGGDRVIKQLEHVTGDLLNISVERVPFTVWIPTPPSNPQWGAKKL